MNSKHLPRLLAAPVLLLGVLEAHAAPFTWANSTGNTNWNSAASWDGGIAPANNTTADNAIFTSVANAQPGINALSRIKGVDFQMAAGGLNFAGASTFLVGSDGIDSTGQTSGLNTISVDNIQLNAAGTWSFFSTANTSSTSTFTINSTVNLNGNNLTINGKRSNTAGNVGVINFNGVISGNANVSVHPDNFRTQTHFTASNTYNGTTSIRGFLNVNSLANAGTASALGSSGDIIIGNSGSSAGLIFSNVSSNSTTDRRVLFQGTAVGGVFQIANNSATGTVSFTNTGTIGDAAGATIQDLLVRLGGSNTGLNTFGQVIDNRGPNATGITAFQKEGLGTWALTGNNTYTGATTISSGTLSLARSGGESLASTASVTVSTGATLLLSQSDQVNNSAAVTLSGGTIRRDGNVSEVFGNLNLTAPSFLDYGAGVANTLRFGTYTPTSLLTVQNFAIGNKLQFGNTISTGDLSNPALFSFSSAFTTGTEGGFFTITAIPEPSTILAALGLAGLMLWPVARRRTLTSGHGV